VIRLFLKFTELFLGRVCKRIGDEASFSPPVGITIFAQLLRSIKQIIAFNIFILLRM
jgi:hypothetical protein